MRAVRAVFAVARTIGFRASCAPAAVARTIHDLRARFTSILAIFNYLLPKSGIIYHKIKDFMHVMHRDATTALITHPLEAEEANINPLTH